MKTEDEENLSQGGVAFAKLMQAIEAGIYQPGDRLREIEVSERLTLSRTPVREALRRLEAENIIEHRPRYGAVIRKLGQAEVVELYEMRLVLERTAAEMAAKHAAEAEVDAMAALNDEISNAQNNAARAAAINQRFHQAIYLSARNRFLLDAARAMNNALLLLGPTTLADPERVSIVVHQHQQIMDAIGAGDMIGAGAAAEAHLQTSLRYRLKVMWG
ncbi:GntR family transcriptional regulator [Octadecabacter sp. 1_MG-2023]|uniref:GntR family transcriptional regulator n=1 Tax=unclassified Octadecabacter TaxID=196158 RepID=UPI001C091F05|nr:MULTISPECIES: GntR family transcriptional regulator [unclassified Octadecabacter]MBU2994119.1 GntR family transcriptional regulator [Octadecabacter sp. B2R22]MDO6734592.1 GntR family transcriptional regulator [Octadecabacter sp. 1_MG-2023]